MKTKRVVQVVLLMFVLLVGTETQAEIIYSGTRNVTYSATSNPGTFSLFNLPETLDNIRLERNVYEFPGSVQYSFEKSGSSQNYVIFAAGDFSTDIKRFSEGDWISGSTIWSFNNGLFFRYVSNETGTFERGEFFDAVGYAGIRLSDGINVYYGWIQVAIVDADSSSISATLIDWAYEDRPGQGISAGAVPEPSTTALFFGGALALLTALRRRKKQIEQ